MYSFLVFIIQDKLSSTKLLEELKSENKNVNNFKIGSLQHVTRNVNGKAWCHVCKQLLAVFDKKRHQTCSKKMRTEMVMTCWNITVTLEANWNDQH